MPPPVISVVIPAYGYPAGLSRVLTALAQQDFAGSFEVLVMDDGSPVPLEPVTQPYRDVLNIRCLRLDNGGPARARNAGARAAQGEWVAFTDHDCEPAPDWLAQLVQEGERSGSVLMGGRRVTELAENDWSVAHDMLCVFASGWSSDVATPYFSTDNLAAPRMRFLEVGGFDERFQYSQEDREFCARWRARGFETRSVPTAIIRHSHAFTRRTFCRQHFRYGENAHQYYRIRNIAGPAWPLAARLRFYSSLLRYPWRTLPAGRAFRISAMLGLCQLCYGCGYYLSLLDSRRRRNRFNKPSARTSHG
jgi:GT2 family glycosyltransferase